MVGQPWRLPALFVPCNCVDNVAPSLRRHLPAPRGLCPDISRTLPGRQGVRYPTSVATMTARAPSWLFLLLAFFAAASSAPSHQAQVAAQPQTASDNPYLNTRPGMAYVGSKACAACHQDIYNQFERTGMGQSIFLASDPDRLARLPCPCREDAPRGTRSFSGRLPNSGVA